jgi:hypothetical protein
VQVRRIAVVVLVLAGVVWPAASGVATNPATTQAAAAGSLQADFNNDGFADLAVTVPYEDVGAIPDAGAVHVLYGAPTGLGAAGGQLLTQDSPGVPGVAEVGDVFGSALAAGDFDDDGFADLAVGVDGESLGGGATTAGAVNVLYGTAGGLMGVGSQVFTQDSPGVPGVAELGDVFGVALAAGDFDGDGFDDLVVGVPGEDLGGVEFGGAVNVLGGAGGGLTGSGSQLFTQDSPGVDDSAEGFDGFGEALATGDFDDDGFADLAVGVNREDLGGLSEAGAVNVLPGTPGGLTGIGSQLLTQDSPGVGSVAEVLDVFGYAVAAGDFNRDGFVDLAVGAAFEDVGAVQAAGAVNVLPGASGGLTGIGSQLLTQNSPGVPGSAELDDVFGYALATGDFDNNGFTDLAVGVPGENLGAVEAGATNVLLAADGGLTGAGGQLLSQDSPGVPGVAEEDFFAEGLTAADFDDDGFDDLAVGVPGEDVGAVMEAGAANVVYGAAGGLTATGSQLFTQDTPGMPDTAEGDDLFALGLAASGPQRATAPPASLPSRSSPRPAPADR